MFAASIPLLPPPSTSLLPPIHDRPESFNSAGTGSNNAAGQAHRANRGRSYQHLHYHHHHGSRYPPSSLSLLSLDERTITQRKLAIAMYGYSWLKPAGCTKTMLGRREEEIEREEVERQLREVEMQERNAVETEQQEMRGRLEEQARREQGGEVIIGEGEERDLDEEVPDMDAVENQEDEDEEDEEEDEDPMGDEVDLDDEIPEADNSNWAYDTTRDPDTDSAEDGEDLEPGMVQLHDPLRNPARLGAGRRREFATAAEQEQAEQEALVNEMLDEDELGGMQRDLDDEVPDLDVDMDMDMDEEHDLDDEVPEADADDGGGWEHTDSELEESDMDISILPVPPRITAGGMGRNSMLPPPPSSSAGRARREQRQRYSTASENSINFDIDRRAGQGMRRISGNMLPPAPGVGAPAFHYPRPHAATSRGQIAGQRRNMVQTPGTVGSELSISTLISTGNSDVSVVGNHNAVTGSGVVGTGNDVQGVRRTSWLNPAGARRNLFGAVRNTSGGDSGAQLRSVSASEPQNPGPGRVTVQSGGLFTPSPRQGGEQGSEMQTGAGFEAPSSSVAPPTSAAGRTRSTRLLGRARRHGRGPSIEDT